MPPIEIPITACRCFRPRVSVARRYSASTMSRVLNAGNIMPGCVVEFDGDDEIPSPNESTAMTKYFAGSTSSFAATKPARLELVPEKYEGKRTAFERSALSVPQVRYPSLQPVICCPLASLQTPRSANCC